MTTRKCLLAALLAFSRATPLPENVIVLEGNTDLSMTNTQVKKRRYLTTSLGPLEPHPDIVALKSLAEIKLDDGIYQPVEEQWVRKPIHVNNRATRRGQQ